MRRDRDFKEIINKMVLKKEAKDINKQESKTFNYGAQVVSDPIKYIGLNYGKNYVTRDYDLLTIDSVIYFKYPEKEKKLPKISTSWMDRVENLWREPRRVTTRPAEVNRGGRRDTNFTLGTETVRVPLPETNRPYRGWSEEAIHDTIRLNNSIIESSSQAIRRNTASLLDQNTSIATRVLLEQGNRNYQSTISLRDTQIRQLREELEISRQERERNNIVTDELLDLLSEDEDFQESIEQAATSTQETRLESVTTTFIDDIHPFPDYRKYIDSYFKEEKVKERVTFSQELKTNLSKFKGNYAANPAIIKGYIFNDRVFYDNTELKEFLTSTPNYHINWKTARAIVKVFTIKEDKIKNKIISLTNFKLNMVSKTPYIQSVLPLLVKFRVRSSKNSDIFFNDDNKRNRAGLIDINNLDWKVDYTTVTRQKTKYNTCIVLVEHPETKEEIKLLLSDCEFINKSLGTYIAPLDKTITVNSIVSLKNSNSHKYQGELSGKLEVVSIKPDPSSKKISINSRNRRKDIIGIKTSSGKIHNVYAEDLKFIENKQVQNNVNTKKEDGKKPGTSSATFRLTLSEDTFTTNIWR